MITMRPFSKGDWFGMCDAQRFEDGSEPLIGELRLAEKNIEAIVVLDGAGLGICLFASDEATDANVYGEEFVNFEGAFAARAVASLRNGMSLVELVALPGCRGVNEDDIFALTRRGAA